MIDVALLALKWLKKNWLETLVMAFMIGCAATVYGTFVVQRAKLKSMETSLDLMTKMAETQATQMKDLVRVSNEQRAQLEDIAQRQALLTQAVQKTLINTGKIDRKFDDQVKARNEAQKVAPAVPAGANAEQALGWTSDRAENARRVWAGEKK